MFPFAESHPQPGEEAPPFMGERRPPQGQPLPSALAKLFPKMQIPELEPSWQPSPTSGGGECCPKELGSKAAPRRSSGHRASITFGLLSISSWKVLVVIS